MREARWSVLSRRAVLRRVAVGSVALVAAGLTSCSLLSEPQPAPPPVTVTATATATVIATPTPKPTPTPEAEPPPPPPPPPTPPNDLGGQTDGGNTANTPVVQDTGPQEFAQGPSEAVNGYEFRYTVAQGDQLLAIASRFMLQTVDVQRVNFPCSDGLTMQPGDTLDIRWPLDSEQLGSACTVSR